jgi:hypothetical protein
MIYLECSRDHQGMFRPSPFRNAILAGCCLACIAWLASGCRSARVSGNDASARAKLGIVTEADDGPQPQNGFGPPTDFMERHSKRLAGPSGIDCGRVDFRADPKKANDCALRANKAGKPFRVRYDLLGADSVVAETLVRLPDGTMQALLYDGDPSGLVGGVISRSQCPTPIHLYTTPEGQLRCVPPKPPNRPPNR